MAREKMKTFKGYLTEFAIQSTSDYVFNTGTNSSGLMIPISGPMFKRIWPNTIRATVFHATDADHLAGLKRLEGGKKSISAFFSMMANQMEGGIATDGGVVIEMEADVLISAKDDIMSAVDKGGRRWVEMSWFENAQGRGNPAGFDKVEKDLNTLIKDLVKKHLTPILGKNAVVREHEYELWSNMKDHLKAGREGGGKRLSLVIKDYFDGVEKVIKKNKKVFETIFYGYAKSKRQTDYAWDEQIVNNIKIKKVHILSDVVDLDGLHDMYPKGLVHEFPDVKFWDYSSELEIYTREVVKKEIGK
jgi:hypothetical protein